MRRKWYVAIPVLLMLTLGLTVSCSATGGTEYIADNETIFYEEEYYVDSHENCPLVQHERLMELMNGDFVIPLDSKGEPVSVPSVNFVMPPEGSRDYFLIGVVDEPTQECIDFILFYTGIPKELAYIAQATLTRQPLFN